MNSLTICSHNINVVDDLYSLNDLHKASGNQVKHKPSNFLQNQETKALIAEIESENLNDGIPSFALKVIRGTKGGTYVCKELVYRYAMWISAKFSLMVIRAFDGLVSRSDSHQREILVKACSKLAIGNMLISDVYLMVGKQFGYEGGIKDIPTPLLPEAVAFVYEMILRLKPTQQPQGDNEYTKKMFQLGKEKANKNREMLEVIQKALTDLDYGVTEISKNNATQYSIFQDLKTEIALS